ncbi:MAG: PAS domain S-box protein, partial [Bacteroidales bacterium]|nr:PAS domain S-box protein [Bacteroidales bacterium]
MNFQEKSKEELLNELLDLQQKYNSVELLYQQKIYESRQTEQTLHENEANIKAIIENSLESIWSIDTNYNIQYLNKVFSEAFQQSFGVLLEKGVNILESIPPNLRTIWKERYDRGFNNEHFVFTDKIELENRSIHIEVAINPVVINDKVVGTSFFGKDITEQKLAEIALKESEDIFRNFLENSPIYIFFKDKNIRALRLSKNYEQMVGMPLSKIIGKSMDELFPSDLAKKMIAVDKKILNERKSVTVDEELNGRFYT